jgi:hypothetical protein
MLVLVVTATIHWLAALGQAASVDPLSQQVLARVANLNRSLAVCGREDRAHDRRR